MKLIQVLAALTFFAVPAHAEDYDAALARIQWPKIKRAVQRYDRSLDMGDLQTACSELGTVVLLTRWNLEGLEQIAPNQDWMTLLNESRSIHEEVCL